MSDICTASVKFWRPSQSPTQPRETVREDVDTCSEVAYRFLQHAGELAQQQNIPFPERHIAYISSYPLETTTTVNPAIPGESEISPSLETPKQIDQEKLEVEITIDSGNMHMIRAMGTHPLNSVEAHSKISRIVYASLTFVTLGMKIENEDFDSISLKMAFEKPSPKEG